VAGWLATLAGRDGFEDPEAYAPGAANRPHCRQITEVAAEHASKLSRTAMIQDFLKNFFLHRVAEALLRGLFDECRAHECTVRRKSVVRAGFRNRLQSTRVTSRLSP
jgi:hypothetical protein